MKYLSALGGKNAKDQCRRAMNALASNAVLSLYSYKGQSKGGIKKKFSSLAVCQMIKGYYFYHTKKNIYSLTVVSIELAILMIEIPCIL